MAVSRITMTGAFALQEINPAGPARPHRAIAAGLAGRESEIRLRAEFRQQHPHYRRFYVDPGPQLMRHSRSARTFPHTFRGLVSLMNARHEGRQEADSFAESNLWRAAPFHGFGPLSGRRTDLF
jgi:hypothetical protein